VEIRLNHAGGRDAGEGAAPRRAHLRRGRGTRCDLAHPRGGRGQRGDGHRPGWARSAKGKTWRSFGGGLVAARGLQLAQKGFSVTILEMAGGAGPDCGRMHRLGLLHELEHAEHLEPAPACACSAIGGRRRPGAGPGRPGGPLPRRLGG
jgi:hypothetical protein